jgi:hypothetical protein
LEYENGYLLFFIKVNLILGFVCVWLTQCENLGGGGGKRKGVSYFGRERSILIDKRQCEKEATENKERGIKSFSFCTFLTSVVLLK